MSPSPRQFSPGIYLVADSALAAPRALSEVIEAAILSGVTMVQVREKDMTARELFDLTLTLSRLTRGRASLIIDDRVDVFLAARAAGAAVDGVHVGQSDLPVAQVRQLIGPAAVLGLTANTEEHLHALERLDPGTVDYLGVGVIRPTQTKKNHPAALGVAGFGQFCAATALPCVAIGGIVHDDVAPLRAAGAAGVAVVSAICAAEDPGAAALKFTRAWTSSAGVS